MEVSTCLVPPFGVAVAGDEPRVAVVGDALLDPGHRCLPAVSESAMSAQCPQTLPRSSATVGEGRRKFNVLLTCDFALTWLTVEVKCEPVGEPGTALITQRSQVQILPPLQSKAAGQKLFSEDPGTAFWRFLSSAAPVRHPDRYSSARSWTVSRATWAIDPEVTWQSWRCFAGENRGSLSASSTPARTRLRHVESMSFEAARPASCWQCLGERSGGRGCRAARQHTHTDLFAMRPVVRDKRALCGYRSPNRLLGGRKHYEEAVALRAHLDTAEPDPGGPLRRSAAIQAWS